MRDSAHSRNECSYCGILIMLSPLRTHKSYLASIGHRVSGLALTLFLPIHFLMLASALGGSESLDTALALVEQPVFKIAEWGLVFFLALHLSFGIRVIALEISSSNSPRKFGKWVISCLGFSLLVSVLMLIQMM
ncbi:MAG: succinate dehydrogenase, cytochrome b556 subunit [Gammaproteobacteria bacterium]|nr:succinate dehydrogenase, cytochrome b556 subunit [Gammaproteobacteria bacterium]